MRLIKTILMSLTIAANLNAAPPESNLNAANKRIEQLEAELKSIKSDNARLRQEVARNLAIVKAAETAGITIGESYGSVVDILRSMPKDLQPKRRTGWDQFTRDLAFDWLRKNPVTKQFEAKLKVSKVSVSANSLARLDPSQPKAVATIYFQPREYRYLSLMVTQYVGTVGFKLYGDEKFGKKVSLIKSGHVVKVSGLIRGVTINGSNNQIVYVRLDLSEPKLESSLIRP